MALLGSSVDPRLFMQDYSGFTRAAEIQAQGVQNLGAAIGQGIKDFGEARQERKKLDASIKANRKSIESALKLGESLGIDVSSLNPILEQMDDPNVTPMEAAALGQAGAQRITDTLNLGIKLQDREIERSKALSEAQYKQGMLGAAQTRAAASLFSARAAAQPSYTFQEYNVRNPITGEYEKRQLPVNPKTARPRDIEANRDILNVQDWYENKGGLAPEESELPPTSQVGGSASDLIASAANGTFNVSYKTRDQLPKSSANNRLISLDFNAAANPNARGVEVIIPNNATPQEKAAAQRYVNGTVEMFAKYGVKVPNRGVKTVAQNKRGASDVIHLEPAFGMDKESMAILQQYPEEYAKVVSDSFSGLPVTVIPPHKQGDPGASANGITEQGLAIQRLIPAFERLSQQGSAQASPTAIHNALAMGGDMTQQAMGTPQQQAMLSQQIEQGAGMATAQNIPQGAMPTEASMATQQPQLPQQAAPNVNLRSGFTPVRSQANKPTTMMTAEQVKNLEGQGFRVSAIPNPDGTFMVSGVTTGGSSSGFEVTTPEGTTVRYGGSGGLTQPKVGPGQQLVPDPTSPTGTRVVDVPGGEAEKAAKQEAAAAEAARKRGIELGSVALAEIDNFINYTDRMSQLPFASPARKIFAAAGMEEQSEAESSLATVAANLKFEALDALRKASPTGASGLGQVTQTEFQSLSDQWGALRLTGDPEKIKERAIRIKKQLLDIVHGDQAHRDALLKTNVITKQQYDEIQSQYPGAKQASREDANLERWRKSFTPQPTQ